MRGLEKPEQYPTSDAIVIVRDWGHRPNEPRHGTDSNVPAYALINWLVATAACLAYQNNHNAYSKEPSPG